MPPEKDEFDEEEFNREGMQETFDAIDKIPGIVESEEKLKGDEPPASDPDPKPTGDEPPADPAPAPTPDPKPDGDEPDPKPDGDEPDPKPDGDEPPADPAPASTPDPTIPPHLNAEQRENWTNLRKAKETAEATAQELEKRAKEAEARLAEIEQAGGIPKDVSDELQRLRQIASRIDVHADPKFREVYQKPIEDARTRIETKLAANGFSEDDVKALTENDWWSQPYGFWKKNLIDKLENNSDPAIQDFAILLEEEVKSLKAAQAKEAEAKSGQVDIDTFVQQRREEQLAEYKKEIEFFDAQVEEIRSQVPWLQRVDVEKAENKEEAKDQNEFVDQAEGLFREVFTAWKPEKRFKAAQLAVLAMKQGSDIQRLISKNAEMSKELETLREQQNKVRVHRRVGGVAPSAPAKPSPVDLTDPSISVQEATDAAMDSFFQS